jgi:hypothetical protein
MSNCDDPEEDGSRFLYANDGRCWRETPEEANYHAEALGTNGGLTTSFAKTIAARNNGQLGGWWSWHDGPPPPQPPPYP